MKKINQINELKKQLTKETASLLYISMPNCSVCEAVKAPLEKIAREQQIPLLHIDAVEVPLVASEFQVMAAPAILVFSYGKELQRQARFINFNRISELLDQLATSDLKIDYDSLFY